MMIGPRQAQAPCPWCQGTGEDHEQRWQEWDPCRETYVPRVQVVACDGCNGRGRVTKPAAQQMRQA